MLRALALAVGARRKRPPTLRMITSGTDNTVTLTTSSATQITIYWGDGTSTSKTGASQVSAHTYSDGVAGHYISIDNPTALVYLDCHSNQFTALDVTQCTALTVLRCYSNQLTALDVTQCTALTDLRCYANQFTALDVTQCTALTVLDCYLNQLTALDVTQCTALTVLRCHSNQFTALDVTQCTALTVLYCSSNQLTALDVTQCTALTSLYCNDNAWSEAVVDNVLVDLEATVVGNPRAGTLQIHGTNAAPSAGTGCPAYCSLVNTYGWSVTITGSCSC